MGTNKNTAVLTEDEVSKLLDIPIKENEVVKFLIYRDEFTIALGAIRLNLGESTAGAFIRNFSGKNIFSVPITEMCYTTLGFCAEDSLNLPSPLTSRIERLGDNLPEDDIAAIEEVVTIIRDLVFAGFTLAVEGRGSLGSDLMWYSRRRCKYEGDETILAYLRPQ